MSLFSIYIGTSKMDSIKVYECFSIIHDICKAHNVSPFPYYKMLQVILKKKVVRGKAPAVVLFSTQDKWCDCLEKAGFSESDIFELHDMLNQIYYYLDNPKDNDACDTDDDSDYEESESDDSDFEYDSECELDCDSGDSDDEDDSDDNIDEEDSDEDHDYECSDNKVFDMLVNQLGGAKTNAQLAWIGGYITATVFNPKMNNMNKMKNT